MINKLEVFINRANDVHGKKYNYSLVQSNNYSNKIIIICPIHGQFMQRGDSHLSGRGCRKCSSGKITKSIEDCITDFKQVHNNFYDYSLVDYKNTKTKVTIVCPIHGQFNQIPSKHLSGQGCTECSLKRKSIKFSKANDEFIKEAKEKQGDLYDYSLVKYTNNITPVNIICQVHGVFKQTPSNHLKGRGCFKCSHNKRGLNSRFNSDEVLDKCRDNFNDKYDYTLANYITIKDKLDVICPIHGLFSKIAESHIKGQGCPKCAYINTIPETELTDFLTNDCEIEIIKSDRTILKPKELDVLIPSHNLAIEYNGLYFHNELHKDSKYHLNKTNDCEAKGIQLIHIFEDEWLYKKEIVKSRIKNILGLTDIKIYARKCIIKEVSPKGSKDFLNKNHIQGNVNSKIKIGLYYNEELVSLMTFNNPRNNKINGVYELIRFCTKLDTSVIGGASKLLQYFIKTYNPKEIISYADRRWSQGTLYDNLGFNKINVSKEDYSYIIKNKRFHKSSFKKKNLISNGFDKNSTEHEIMLSRKIYRIYDCGKIKYSIILK